MRLGRNMGPADRLVRLVVGGSLVLFGALGLFPGGWQVAVTVAGAAVALTGILGYCPLYHVLRLGWRPPGRHGSRGVG